MQFRIDRVPEIEYQLSCPLNQSGALMKLNKLSPLNLISLLTMLACVALCFHGCGKQQQTQQQTQKSVSNGPTPLQNGTWKLSNIRFPNLGSTSRLSPTDQGLSDIQSIISVGSQNNFISLETFGSSGMIEVNFTDCNPTCSPCATAVDTCSCCDSTCTLRIPAAIAYTKPSCCSFISLTLDRVGMVESTPGCVASQSGLSVDEVFDQINSHLGVKRKYLYSPGASKMNIGDPNQEQRATFEFQRI